MAKGANKNISKDDDAQVVEATTDGTTEMFSEYPDLITVDELCSILGSKDRKMGRKKVYGLLRRKEIPSFRIGRDYRIVKSSVVEYIRSRENNF